MSGGIKLVRPSAIETEACRWHLPSTGIPAPLRVTVQQTDSQLLLRIFYDNILVDIAEITSERGEVDRAECPSSGRVLQRIDGSLGSPWPVERVTEPRHSVQLTVGRTTSGMSPTEARALAVALIEAAASREPK